MEWKRTLEDVLQTVDIIDPLADVLETERVDEGNRGGVVRADRGGADVGSAGCECPAGQAQDRLARIASSAVGGEDVVAEFHASVFVGRTMEPDASDHVSRLPQHHGAD